MKKCFFAMLVIGGLIAFAAIADAAPSPSASGEPCTVSGKDLVLIAAGPLGVFGNRATGGSCANGQCTASTAVVTTAPATPTATGTGQTAISSPGAAVCANGSCGQSTAKRVGPVRRFFQRFRR